MKIFGLGNRGGKARRFTERNVLTIGSNAYDAVKREIMRCVSKTHPASFVVPDTGGRLLRDTQDFLEEKGYCVKTLNLANFGESMRYNQFPYIESEQDVFNFARALIANTSSPRARNRNARMGDDFWDTAETILYVALVGYILSEGRGDEKNMETLLSLLNEMEVWEMGEDWKCVIDSMFDEFEKEHPEHFAVRQYKKFKKAPVNTAKNILVSCGARLAPFDTEDVRRLMSYHVPGTTESVAYLTRDIMRDDESDIDDDFNADENEDEMNVTLSWRNIELDWLGRERTALFVVLPETEDTYDFICGLLYSQLFDTLRKTADDFGGILPLHVRCVLPSAAIAERVPAFGRLLGTIRGRNASVCLLAYSAAQVRAVFKENADAVFNNCDTVYDAEFLSKLRVRNSVPPGA